MSSKGAVTLGALVCRVDIEAEGTDFLPNGILRNVACFTSSRGSHRPSSDVYTLVPAATLKVVHGYRYCCKAKKELCTCFYNKPKIIGTIFLVVPGIADFILVGTPEPKS